MHKESFQLKLDELVTTSEHVIKDIEKNIGRRINKKITFFSDGIDLSKFYPSKKISSYHIITVTRLISTKGLERTIKAIPYIQKEIPNVKLLIVAPIKKRDDIYFKHIKDLIKNLDCEKNVEFAGGIPHNQIHKLYQSSKIFLLTSFSEGEPTVIMEAMACGLPIIATSVGSIPIMIEDGKKWVLSKRE